MTTALVIGLGIALGACATLALVCFYIALDRECGWRCRAQSAAWGVVFGLGGLAVLVQALQVLS